MPASDGLAKAAAIMATVAAPATMLAVYVAPPAAQNARQARDVELSTQKIPVPAATARGGASAAQGRGTAVERREASGGRAPKAVLHFSRSPRGEQ